MESWCGLFGNRARGDSAGRPEVFSRSVMATVRVGTTLRKKFAGCGFFDGKVVAVADGRATIEWSDDTTTEMTAKEVEKCCAKAASDADAATAKEAEARAQARTVASQLKTIGALEKKVAKLEAALDKVKKAAAKKAAAKKPAAAKKTDANKPTAAKKDAAKKPAAKPAARPGAKPAAKKPASKKKVAKTATVKKPAAKKPVAKKKAVKKKETPARRACPVELLTFSVADDEAGELRETYVVHSAPEINKAHKLKVPKKSATWFEITEDSEPLKFSVNFTMKDGEGSGSSIASNDNEEIDTFDFNTLQNFYGENETKGLPQSIQWTSLLGYAATFDMKKTKGGIKVRVSTVIIKLEDRETILQRC